MTAIQTLPNDKKTLEEFFNRDFGTMQKQYRRHTDEYKTFEEPQTLPSQNITLHHLFNVCKFCYPNDKASLDILQKLPPLPQFTDTKKVVIDEVKPPSQTNVIKAKNEVDRERLLKEEIEALRENIEAKNKRIESLQGETNRSKEEITQAKKEASTALTVAQQRQEAILKLQNEVQTLRTAKENADRQIQTAQTTQTSIDKTVQTLQTQHKNELSEMSAKHEKEMSTLSKKNKADIESLQEQHEADTIQTNQKLLEVQTENDNLKSQIEETERQQNSFVGKLKSKTVTVLGLLCVVIYQGLHSQHFFADRATNKDDLINMVFSCFAAFAISLAGFLLTLHTKNKVWIWGAAAIDFCIYITPKEMSIANFLAAFAVAASIVAYSHILQKEE